MNACVHKEHEQAAYAGKGYTDEQSKQDDAVALRSYRRTAAVGAVDDARIVVGHSLRESVLLALVQQEQIQGLLDFLLTLDRKDLTLLTRNRRYAVLCPHLAVLGIVAFHVQAYNHIVNGTYDVLLHRTQRVVQLLHHRVVLAAVVYKPVALKFSVII